MTSNVIKGRWSAPQPARNYAEASYFDGYHFQHIADWLQAERLMRLERQHAAYVRSRTRWTERF